MRRTFLTALALLLSLACATVQTHPPPGGYVYQLQRDDNDQVEAPVPQGWTVKIPDADCYRCGMEVKSPDGRVNFLVVLYPGDHDTTSVLQGSRPYLAGMAGEAGTTLRGIEGTIGGFPARGMQFDGEKTHAIVLVADHPHGLYIETMMTMEGADQNGLAAGRYIFDQLRIIEGQRTNHHERPSEKLK